ncbi:hypothetical protein NMY22_g14744 [Coprinellus aureogranulatus]|nr:hypothetical protein NMY22_g14744 [Coprinellus aureogranulatus]
MAYHREPPPEVGLPKGLELIQTFSRYAQHGMRQRNGLVDRVALPTDVPPFALADLEKLGEHFLHAWRNQLCVDISVKELLDVVSSNPEDMDAALREACGVSDDEPDYLLHTRPALFHDRGGTVVAWYLPSLFSNGRDASVYESLETADRSADKSLLSSPSTWALPEHLYANPKKVNIAPGEVDITIWDNESVANNNSAVPTPSPCLSDPTSAAMEFLYEQEELNALFGALLSLVHPEMFFYSFRQ